MSWLPRIKSPSRFRNQVTQRRLALEALEDRLVLATSQPVEIRQFDFDTDASPTEPGWVSVKKGELYDLAIGYGWETPVAGDTYLPTISGNSVVKDGHTGTSGNFQIDVVPNSRYTVELIFRDARPHEFQVSLEGGRPSVIKMTKPKTVTKKFSKIVSTDHILSVQFDAPGLFQEFIISGLKITGAPVGPNIPPQANKDTLTLNEDTSATIDVLTNDIDANGDPLTVTAFGQGANGSVRTNAGVLTYTPNRNFSGNDQFSYTVTDNRGGYHSANVRITVRNVQDIPLAISDVGPGFTTAVDASFTTANVLDNDRDPDGDALSTTWLDTTSTLGTVTDNGNGTFDYVPLPGFVGTDLFHYEIRDVYGATATAAVAITVGNQSTKSGIWISADEIMSLPTSGPAWDSLLDAANTPAKSPDIKNQDDNTDALTLAKALVGVRLVNQKLLAEARANILAAIGTEVGGRTLALGRNLASYVIAAELVGLMPQDEAVFRAWLRAVLTEDLGGKSLQSTHEERPNNWGTMSGASRAAVAVYLGDLAELERTATVFRGYLGDRSAYAGFEFGSDLSWQADPTNLVPINPKGATKDGQNIDGALPEEMRRGGPFALVATKTGYAWEGLQGAIVQAEILHRAGYDSWQWQDQALLRAVDYLYRIGWEPEGDDRWQPWLINARYGTNYAVNEAARYGKVMGWTSWTHAPPPAPLGPGTPDA